MHPDVYADACVQADRDGVSLSVWLEGAAVAALRARGVAAAPWLP